ncbi:hypothetical protein MPDQ_008209 [Monascus purpureus]|uniref:Uncharacterized protein n=1 Tax=Monascus purpureus TaxID=5098 RepID=A0A507QUN2_MONPU|nr:hypothetical protein MPDQ_008209 [Monascus purpureus]
MFAMYLDIQKEILLEDLSPEEVKGRWKSFVRKWNRGELAEGWYDPETLRKARKSAKEGESYFAGPSRRSSPDYEHGREEEDEGEGSRVDRVSRHPEEDRLRRADREDRNEEEDEEEDYGPVLPETQGQQLKHSSGPTIPKLQDLELRKEMAIEDAEFAHEQSKLYHRAAARSHRDEMKEMQDFVAPRAEPGTHERRLEKRREAAAANRAFAESSRRGGSPEAAPDEELMGSGENDLEVLKKAQEKEKRKKNEREIRREEILRARAAEREERVKRYRQKEEETIGWLKTLAKQRFG